MKYKIHAGGYFDCGLLGCHFSVVTGYQYFEHTFI